MQMQQLLVGLAGAITFCAGTAAQADNIADCERYAVAFLKKGGVNVSKVQIDRGESLYDNRYDDKVGSQRVSSEYIGTAAVSYADGVKRQRFVCLHEGDGKRAVYFAVIPE